jgi:two-component sensor histidine kinase
MVLHELATNATKHGALSTSGGRVRLTWQLDECDRLLRLGWIEEGGPTLSGPPQRRGFGSRVIIAMIEDQLGGKQASMASLRAGVGSPSATVPRAGAA